MRVCVQVGRAVAVALWLGSVAATPAMAQSLGTFSWQLQPYCNVLVINVTQVGATYRLEGFDDQCGAATRASLIGTAFQNPDATIGLGLNLVATPGGTAVHIDATVTAAGFNGTWRDNLGGVGAFTFGPGGLGGPPRPLAPTGPAVTTLTAGSGLIGGGSASTLNLAVNFAGPGAASTVARSDHTHAAPGDANTAVGARALQANVSGSFNTAIGQDALPTNTAANGNLAIGVQALYSIAAPAAGNNLAVGNQALRNTTSGFANVAVGAQALQSNTIGTVNVAMGSGALFANTNGAANVAIGRLALSNQSGVANYNIALGFEAGTNALGGSSNIFIGNSGAAADTETIKIGTVGTQTRTFIAGINGGVLDPATDIPVYVDAFGKVGTTASSARFKTDVTDIAADGQLLQRLRPVSFRYLPLETRGSTRQYGLIAEEVAAVLPELVVNDADGRPWTVRYQLLPPLLLAEVQRLERERSAQREQLAAQASRLAAHAQELAALRALVDALLARR